VRTQKKDIPIGRIELSHLGKFGRWLEDQDIVEASPFANVKRPTKEIQLDRVLSNVEIRAIWEACGELGAFGRAFRFMLVSGQRRTEVGAMAWAELDRKQALWNLPRGRTKADRAHEVPLSAGAVHYRGMSEDRRLRIFDRTERAAEGRGRWRAEADQRLGQGEG
jgi:integrase